MQVIVYKNLTRGRKSRRQAGFSLMEIIIALFVMAIIYCALFVGVSTNFRLLQTVREDVRATQIIVSRIERLRLCAWNNDQLFNTTIVPTNFTDYFYPLGLNGSTNTGTRYSGSMSISQSPTITPGATYYTNMALVTVTITWTNGPRNSLVAHTRSMSTYVSRFGMQNYVYYH